MGNRGSPSCTVDQLFFDRMERSTPKQNSAEGCRRRIHVGGGPVLLFNALSAKDEGPFRSVRMGSLLPKSVTDDVSDECHYLPGARSSSVATLGILGTDPVGNGDYGNNNVLSFCSDVRSLLTTFLSRVIQR
mmetsp:Transcript_11956/g.34260  ORF Transcript_11956/g.34260 Transcript_11956/m.34260 type:complete len:132 (-) Transcript_11956:138-533(-)